MTIVLTSLKNDLVRETEGEWIEVPDLPGAEFLVRSIHYPAFRTARDLLVQKFARKYGKKPIPDAVLLDGLGRLYATHILLGWRGFDVEYTPEIAAETLTDPAYRDFVQKVEAAATQAGRVQIEFLEETEKN